MKKGPFAKRKRFRINVFVMLLLSYLFVLLMPVTIFFGVYTQIEKLMIRQAYNANLALIEQVKQVVDNRLDELHLISRYVTAHPKLDLLLKMDVPKTGPEIYEFYSFMKEMQRYRSMSRFVSDFYLYFEKSGTVLTTNLKTTPSLLFSKIYGYGDWTYEQWKTKVLDQVHFNDYLPAAPIGRAYQEDRRIVYMQTLPFGEKKDPGGTLVMYIDERQIKDMLEQIAAASQGTIYIKNANGQVIVSAGEPLPMGTEDDHWGDKTLTVSATSRNGWEYVSVVPEKVLFAKVHAIKTAVISVLVCCIVIGAAASLFLSYRAYRPLREIITFIMKKKQLPDRKFRDEYEFIKSMLASSLEKQMELEEQIIKQAPAFRANFILRMLKGQVNAADLSEDSLAFMGIHMPCPNVAVAVIKLTDASGFIRDDTESEWALIRFVAGKLAEEHPQFTAYAAELEKHMVAVLLSVPEATETRALSQWAEQINRIIEQRFRTKTTIALSSVHRGLEAVPECFYESMRAQDYSIFHADRAVLIYEEIRHGTQAYYDFPIEAEVQLINSVKSGDWNQAKAILDNLYSANFKGKQLTPEVGKLLFADLTSTLFKLLNSLNLDYEDLSRTGNPLESIPGGKSVEVMYQEISSMFADLCERVNASRGDASAIMLHNIKQYIRENYADPMLSLVSIANQFHITAPYLSAFFKKNSGMNLTDFLARTRIEQAKRLMADPHYTISQIAQMVGYTNDVGFIRMFKRYEGITPGKYKEMLQADKNQAILPNAYSDS